MIAQRLIQVWATMVVGDGIVAAIEPRRHAALWRGGPAPYREVVDWCHRHPGATRAIGVAWAGFGLWLALRQLPPPEESR
ncbi:hypothetical protein [Tautonia plasticadhaerens]|uniref:Uncharacterized protein n=1 Tax=Tautonia plasticadhaerens TaxID=2527974 RepID=A0A518H4M7_9BACT|nr:hypothetical protein [Tautonia plasticadhaerens]QDV35793.1 hypothetical protein ElP_37010 [Tautonia plasticadhaerens]